jgi:hypothetical protein
MAVATIRAVSTGASEGAANVVTKPTGTANLDRLVAIVCSDETVGEFTIPPAGFNLVVASTEVAGCPKYRIFEKTAGASEPASYTWDVSVFMATFVWLYALSANQTNLVFGANFGSGTSTACLAPSVLAATHGGTDPLVLTAHSAVTEYTARTFTTPTGMTARGALLNNNWMRGAGFSLATLTGAVATADRTSTISGSEPWRSCNLAVAQAPVSAYKRKLFLPF